MQAGSGQSRSVASMQPGPFAHALPVVRPLQWLQQQTEQEEAARCREQEQEAGQPGTPRVVGTGASLGALAAAEAREDLLSSSSGSWGRIRTPSPHSMYEAPQHSVEVRQTPMPQTWVAVSPVFVPPHAQVMHKQGSVQNWLVTGLQRKVQSDPSLQHTAQRLAAAQPPPSSPPLIPADRHASHSSRMTAPVSMLPGRGRSSPSPGAAQRSMASSPASSQRPRRDSDEWSEETIDLCGLSDQDDDERVITFVVGMPKWDAELSKDELESGEDCLVVLEVPAPMAAWNSRQTSGREVRPGDRIVAVNATRGDAAYLREALTSMHDLTIIVTRTGAKAKPLILSKGSLGHPSNCGRPCKYVRKSRGCKDGTECSYCHICVWHSRRHGKSGKTGKAADAQPRDLGEAISSTLPS